jgi:hypothetical protein
MDVTVLICSNGGRTEPNPNECEQKGEMKTWILNHGQWGL